ncbi:amidase [Bacillus sp. BGMRC 2118]|nr:amidase [Bacillus sp. BGMRC 2118]
MKKFVLIILSLVMFTGVFAMDTNASVTKTQATWLWNPWIIVKDELGTLEFLKKKNINKVYMQIDRDIPATVYQSFIGKATLSGIKIYALDGAPDWVAPKGYRSLDQLTTWLKNYQSGSTSSQRFTGIHLDVEPYLYSGWSTNQATTIKTYQSLLMKAKNSAGALSLPLEADIPFWFDEIQYKNTYGKGILVEWVIMNTHGVSIMAYRDNAAMIIELSQREVDLAGKYKKQVVIGVETGETGEGDYLSFYEEGEAYMNQELDIVDSYYSIHPGYSGIAVHHVDSWKTMRQ